jgi:hypothetical protein
MFQPLKITAMMMAIVMIIRIKGIEITLKTNIQTKAMPIDPMTADTAHPEVVTQETVTAGTTAVEIGTPISPATLDRLHVKQIEEKNNNEDFINRRR